MQIGMIGLGRMGANMIIRLLLGGHDCVVYDHAPEGMARLSALGATATASLQQFVASLKAPRAIWLMVPAAAVDALLEQLTPLLQPGDTVIDGGNSYYQDDRGALKCWRPRTSPMSTLGLVVESRGWIVATA